LGRDQSRRAKVVVGVVLRRRLQIRRPRPHAVSVQLNIVVPLAGSTAVSHGYSGTTGWPGQRCHNGRIRRFASGGHGRVVSTRLPASPWLASFIDAPREGTGQGR